jgi:hypothetical protein
VRCPKLDSHQDGKVRGGWNVVSGNIMTNHGVIHYLSTVSPVFSFASEIPSRDTGYVFWLRRSGAFKPANFCILFRLCQSLKGTTHEQKRWK